MKVVSYDDIEFTVSFYSGTYSGDIFDGLSFTVDTQIDVEKFDDDARQVFNLDGAEEPQALRAAGTSAASQNIRSTLLAVREKVQALPMVEANTAPDIPFEKDKATEATPISLDAFLCTGNFVLKYDSAIDENGNEKGWVWPTTESTGALALTKDDGIYSCRFIADSDYSKCKLVSNGWLAEYGRSYIDRANSKFPDSVQLVVPGVSDSAESTKDESSEEIAFSGLKKNHRYEMKIDTKTTPGLFGITLEERELVAPDLNKCWALTINNAYKPNKDKAADGVSIIHPSAWPDESYKFVLYNEDAAWIRYDGFAKDGNILPNGVTLAKSDSNDVLINGLIKDLEYKLTFSSADDNDIHIQLEEIGLENYYFMSDYSKDETGWIPNEAFKLGKDRTVTLSNDIWLGFQLYHKELDLWLQHMDGNAAKLIDEADTGITLSPDNSNFLENFPDAPCNLTFTIEKDNHLAVTVNYADLGSFYLMSDENGWKPDSAFNLGGSKSTTITATSGGTYTFKLCLPRTEETSTWSWSIPTGLISTDDAISLGTDSPYGNAELRGLAQGARYTVHFEIQNRKIQCAIEPAD